MLAVPARDEAATIGVVGGLALAARDAGVVDRVVVLDGGSVDATVAIAHAHGLETLDVAALTPTGPVRGKGDSVWRFLGTLDDAEDTILVLIDGDVVGLSVDSIAALTRPLLDDARVMLVKGTCPRITDGAGARRWRSGRVSELVARPALAALVPALADLADPLSGQVAVRVAAARGVELATGYGLELAMLLGIVDAHGADAIAEVDLEPIRHRAKDVDELVPVARDVLGVVLARLGTPSADTDAPSRLAAWTTTEGPA